MTGGSVPLAEVIWPTERGQPSFRRDGEGDGGEGIVRQRGRREQGREGEGESGWGGSMSER